MAENGLVADFKRNFLTGLAALFPILITVFLLAWLYGQIDRFIGQQVNDWCIQILSRRSVFKEVFPEAGKTVLEDPDEREQWVQARYPRFIGVGIAIVGALVIIYLVGRSLRGYIGSRVMRLVDGFFERFPVVKSIYPHARQVADFLFGQSRQRRFSRVVAVQYPRRGIYTVGFLTGDGLKDIERAAGQSLVTVFIPTSPTPLTGFIIVVPPDEVLELNMSVDEAFRFCITAGMLASVKQRPWELQSGKVPTMVPAGSEAQQNPEGEEKTESSE